VTALRKLVPRAVRHGISAQVARVQGGRLERDLRAIVSVGGTIVAGPWLGEVGFELLYWVPFLRWFARRFELAPERLLVVSRGGTASWYQPFAGGYREIFDTVSPEEFRRLHDERIASNGEQKQTQVLTFERLLLRRLAADVEERSMLHPSSMYRLFGPFWWGHVGPEWVHARADYARLTAGAVSTPMPAAPYTAVKFYFNECFPATEENRAFARRTVEEAAARGPVVSLATGLRLDDHDGDDMRALGVGTCRRSRTWPCRRRLSRARGRLSAPTGASPTWRRSWVCPPRRTTRTRRAFRRGTSRWRARRWPRLAARIC
jgi:hypothetical protein